MKIKVKIIMMSHLSDLQEGVLPPVLANEKINFVKYLIINFPNTDQEIDADAVYQKFLETRGHKPKLSPSSTMLHDDVD